MYEVEEICVIGECSKRWEIRGEPLLSKLISFANNGFIFHDVQQICGGDDIFHHLTEPGLDRNLTIACGKNIFNHWLYISDFSAF